MSERPVENARTNALESKEKVHAARQSIYHAIMSLAEVRDTYAQVWSRDHPDQQMEKTQAVIESLDMTSQMLGRYDGIIRLFLSRLVGTGEGIPGLKPAEPYDPAKNATRLEEAAQRELNPSCQSCWKSASACECRDGPYIPRRIYEACRHCGRPSYLCRGRCQGTDTAGNDA